MKKKRRKVKISRVIILLVATLLVVGLFGILVTFGFKQISSIFIKDDYIIPEDCHFTKDSHLEFSIDLNSNKYILSRIHDDENLIIYEKAMNERFYPASLTKIMTMYAVLSNVDDSELSDIIKVGYQDLEGLLEANASVLGLNVGDQISVLNTLYGLMLPSGADCANLLDRYLDQKGINIIDEMNRLAKELAMNDTNFTNTTGLFDENNYTTLKDMNSLMYACYQNEIARDILSTLYREDDGYFFKSTMYPYRNYFESENARVLGGKTGYTPQSHLNIASFIDTKYGPTILILAGALEDGEDGRYAHLEDVLDIINYYY